VLICVGGALLGDSAVDPVVSIVNHGCDERIVACSDCRFVFGTTSNVQVISPLVGGGGFGERGSTWMVTVPRHVPTRNEVDPDGPVGVASRPHPEAAHTATSAVTGTRNLLIPSLLPGS
jgi:hypothetical protein